MIAWLRCVDPPSPNPSDFVLRDGYIAQAAALGARPDADSPRGCHAQHGAVHRDRCREVLSKRVRPDRPRAGGCDAGGIRPCIRRRYTPRATVGRECYGNACGMHSALVRYQHGAAQRSCRADRSRLVRANLRRERGDRRGSNRPNCLISSTPDETSNEQKDLDLASRLTQFDHDLAKLPFGLPVVNGCRRQLSRTRDGYPSQLRSKRRRAPILLLGCVDRECAASSTGQDQQTNHSLSLTIADFAVMSRR